MFVVLVLYSIRTAWNFKKPFKGAIVLKKDLKTRFGKVFLLIEQLSNVAMESACSRVNHYRFLLNEHDVFVRKFGVAIGNVTYDRLTSERDNFFPFSFFPKRSRVVSARFVENLKMELGQSTGLISECELFQICVK